MTESSRPPFEIVVCESWDRLVDHLDRLRGWVFRGHCNAAWQLQTTLERHAPLTQARFLSEAELLREFRRRAHNYLGAHEIPDNTGEWLALMQHHGAPTRLLDVTRSPFVAAYFSFEDSPPAGVEEVAVWAINPTWCTDRSGAEALKHWPEIASDVEEHFRAASGAIDRHRLAGMMMAELNDSTLSRFFPAVFPLEPLKISDRVSVQQGMFLWPGNVELSFVDNLRALGAADGVRKYTVPGKERGRALDQLRLMNITRASLFRGLDGFAQSFRQLLITEPPERRDERLLYSKLAGPAPTDMMSYGSTRRHSPGNISSGPPLPLLEAERRKREGEES